MTRPQPGSLPADPMIRELVLRARRAQLSRRNLLQFGGLGAASLALAACSTGSERPQPAEDVSDSDASLVWANWPLYIDEDDNGDYPTLLRFQEETGIQVEYRVDVDDNNSYYGRVRDQLSLGQDIGADTVCLTEWIVARMIRQGYVQEFDRSNMPNTDNLLPILNNADFDPDRTFSMPWQGGFAGIAWNRAAVPNGIRTVTELFENPDLMGRVGVLSEMRDTIGLIMLEQGVDIAGDFTPEQFTAANDVFREQVERGQIRNVKGNSYIEDLQNGDTLAAICWSGDIAALNLEAGDQWEFVIPEAGGTFWNDSFIIPIGSTKKSNVEQLIDYYYQPEVAAEVAAWVNYVTPVEGAQEAARELFPEIAEDTNIFPDEEKLSQVSVFRTLTNEEESEFGDQFQSVLLGA
jgi:spermidine/putrescine transport system substrate-binding protein